MSDDKFENLCGVLVVLIVAVCLAFLSWLPEDKGSASTKCSNACANTNEAMLSYSEKDGCVCVVPQGPL